jgi:hypothetical protein
LFYTSLFLGGNILYNGYIEIEPTDEELADLYQGKDNYGLVTNQYIIIKRDVVVIGKNVLVLESRKLQ